MVEKKDKSAPLVYIIVLNWNGLEDTVSCIESLRSIKYRNYKIVVVDNSSKEEEAKRLRETFSDLFHVIENSENLGFTGGNNIGIEYSLKKGADYVLLLNNDVTVEPDFLDRLVNAGQMYPTIGILGPKIYLDYDRSILWSAGGIVDYITAFTFRNTQKEPYYFYADLVKVGYIIGSAMLIKREVFEKIGLLDNRYFAYEEDIDFCIRAERSGFDSVLVTRSAIYHKAGASVEKILGLKTYYQTRNSYMRMKTTFGDKKGRYLYGYFFITMVNLINIRRILRDEGLKGIKNVIAIMWGIWDGLIIKRYGKSKRYKH